MLVKRRLYWILPLLLSSFVLSHMSFASAQQDSPNFLTYTNTDLGFTIKYPSDWIVNDTKIASDNTVKFNSADGIGHFLVSIGNATQELMTIDTMNNDTAKANALRTFITRTVPGANILELDVSRYFLSGHPATRLVDIESYGRPGGLPTSSQPYYLKAMTYTVDLLPY
jgi:hypothetical protein